MKVYRLGPPLDPKFHRDEPTPIVKQYFKEGAFYAVGTVKLAEEWRTMGDDRLKHRPLFEIELKDTAIVMFFSGWSKTEKIATDLTEVVYTDFGDGTVIDPEECQLVVKLSDVINYKKI